MLPLELRFDGFDWDHGNGDKSLIKHGVSKTVVEDFFADGPFIKDDARHSIGERRYVAIGRDRDGRWMMVAFTIRAIEGKRYLRPISARYMHRKEWGRYEIADKEGA